MDNNLKVVLQVASRSDGLSSYQLQKLSQHKYSALDTSILDKLFMQKFWNWLVEQYPLWWSPNVLTLVGLLANITAVLVLAYFSPDGKVYAPKWTYLFCAFTLFLYQSLDATDGKQARRTNSASPLGELFDHGCDSLSQVFVTMQTCLAMTLGVYPTVLLLVCLYSLWLFYAAHWQTYVCGTLRFTKFDVTEAQFTIILICLISSIFGPQFWAKEVFHIDLRIWAIAITLIPALIQVYGYLSVVFTGGVGKNGSTVADTSVIFPIIPISGVLVPALIIFTKSTSGAFERHIVLYCITFGLVAAKVTNNLVIAHMSKSELEAWDSIFYGPAMLFLNQYFNTFLPEFWVLVACCMYCALNLICFCTLICNQICDYFMIDCFRVSTMKPTYSRQR